MNKNRVKRWKLYKKKQRLVKGAFNRLSPKIKKENKKIIQKLDKIADLENKDAQAEAFDKLSLQIALDNIESSNYKWIKDDPHTIQKAIKYGLRVPEYLLKSL